MSEAPAAPDPVAVIGAVFLLALNGCADEDCAPPSRPFVPVAEPELEPDRDYPGVGLVCIDGLEAYRLGAPDIWSYLVSCGEFCSLPDGAAVCISDMEVFAWRLAVRTDVTSVRVACGTGGADYTHYCTSLGCP